MLEWHQILVRSIFALIVLYTFTRILGKKQISQLSYFEYIMGIVLGELAGFLSTDIEAHYVNGLIAMSVWFAIPFVLDRLALKSNRLRILFEGKQRVMVREGKVLERNLKKERLTAHELMEQLREKNVFRLADVEFAVMETNGELSVMMKKDKQPVTLGDIGMGEASGNPVPRIVIHDGNILDEQLQAARLTRDWLDGELRAHGLETKDVFLAQVDGDNRLYIDKYDDNTPVRIPRGKALTLSQLKKIQADLELYAGMAGSGELSRVYESHARSIDGMISELKPFLKGG